MNLNSTTRLRGAGLAFACALVATACSGGGQSAFPTQAVPQNGLSSSNSTQALAAVASAEPSGVVLSASSRQSVASDVQALPSGGAQGFADNFSTDSVGSPAAGWTVAGGTWSICQSRSGGRQYCATSANGGESLAGSSSWSNYHLDATGSDSDFSRGGIAVLGRVQDPTHFYELELRRDVKQTSQTMWYIWKYNGSAWLEVAGGPFVTHPNADYRFRMAFSGNQISAYVAYDDTTNFQALGAGTDDSYSSGRIGLRSWQISNGRFGDVVVTLDAASASVRPTSAPAPVIPPASGNVARYAGCSIFAPGDAYNADVTSAPVDPHSSDYLTSVTATDNTGFYAETGVLQVNIANAQTPKYTVRQQVAYHAFPVQYPWSSNYYIEPEGDAHSIVLLATPPNCHLYEAYHTQFNGGTNSLSAYGGANWDLTKPFSNAPGPSSMASGLSEFAGMVKHEEIATGIHHALNFKMFANSPCNCYTSPATSTDGISYNGPSTAYALPYGGHLRLKASYDESGLGPQSRAIVEAMKHYGIYLADTGGHYTNNNGVFTANPTDGGSWDQGDLSTLSRIRFSDFDVLRVGAKINR